MSKNPYLRLEVPEAWHAGPSPVMEPLLTRLDAAASEANPITVRPVRFPESEPLPGYVECVSPLSRSHFVCCGGRFFDAGAGRVALQELFACVGFPLVVRLTWWQLVSLMADFRQLDRGWIPWNPVDAEATKTLFRACSRGLPTLTYDEGGATLAVERVFEPPPQGVGPLAGAVPPVRQRIELRFGADGVWTPAQWSWVDAPGGGRWRPDAPQWSP